LKESVVGLVAVAIFNLRHRQNNEKSAMLVAEHPGAEWAERFIVIKSHPALALHSS
jgi:hypothetical protein